MEIYFILVEPARPENVGAAARALKTMGFTQLRVVSSNAHQADQARWVAHGAHEILENTEAFPSLQAAIANMDLVIATTARRRGHCQLYLTPKELQQQLINKQQSLTKVAILFGREESGLSNQELQYADILSYLPLKVDYPSLNLGQAVMLYCYELSVQDWRKEPNANEQDHDSGQLHALQQKVSTLLFESGFLADETVSQWLLQRLPLLDHREIKMVHSLCNHLQRPNKL